MLNETTWLENLLHRIKHLIPRQLFRVFQPTYHWTLSMLGALAYRFPSRSLKVIAVTGTKGKSTTVFMIAKIFEDQGKAVAAIGSLGYKIKDQQWPNTLKMTMPGRFKLQKFLREAKDAGCEYVVLEATSEGIAQNRLTGITVDCAVFTNLHAEHIESHGSFENYKQAKQKLFWKTKHIHVINADDQYVAEFRAIPAQTTHLFGMERGVINQKSLDITLKLAGAFNVRNALAALDVAYAYGLDMAKAKATVEAIEIVPGRMEFIERGQPFRVVVDYAHTLDSLEAVYQTLQRPIGKLICVLGSAGGGRDTWKRPGLGKIAGKYCGEIILTNEDPFDEDPEQIIREIELGIRNYELGMKNKELRVKKILNRREAIKYAIEHAHLGDTAVITGKGSETSMALAGGKKIPWSDKQIAEDALSE